MTALEQLRQHTTVVADTGDFLAMRAFAPRDATTNPSLILKAVAREEYRGLLAEVVAAHRGEPAEMLADRLIVRFGGEILRRPLGEILAGRDAAAAIRHFEREAERVGAQGFALAPIEIVP